MQTMNLQQRWVLVTGASSGLGREMAVQLAREHQANLILVARRLERLQALKHQLELEYPVQVDVIQADLSQAHEVENLFLHSTGKRQISAVVFWSIKRTSMSRVASLVARVNFLSSSEGLVYPYA